MPQTTVLHAKGLFSYPNQLGELPVGALYEAENVVIDREGVISPRRGFATYGNSFGSSGSTADQLLYYKARILRHWGTSLDFDSDGAGTFVNLNSVTITGNTHGTTLVDGISSTAQIVEEMLVTGPGIVPGTFVFQRNSTTSITLSQAATSSVTGASLVFTQPILPQSDGVKIKFQEMNGNLYFTTAEGIQKVSSTTAANVPAAGITFAGGVEALDGDVYLNSTQGWFLQDSTVAYRVVWGINDVNNNLILGDPSQRLLVTNSQLSLSISDFNKLLAALDIVANVPPVVLTGNLYTNTTIDGLSSTSSLSVGMVVTGTYIQSGTTITEITGPNSIVINLPSTNNATAESLTFSQVLTYNNFASFALPADASSIELYDALIALAQQLDVSLAEVVYHGLSGTITNIAPSSSASITGNTTGASNVINNASSVSGISDGFFVSGPGIPVDTTVTSFSSSSPTSFTGDTTINSVTITGVTGSPAINDTITGAGIPTGSFIVSVSGTTITINNPATSTTSAAQLYYFNNTITLSNTITTQSSNATFVFSYPTTITSANHGLVTGSTITIAGSNSTPIIDTTSPVTVTVIDANTFTIPTITSIGGNAGTWTQYPAAIAEQFPTPPANPATNAELVLLQNFYDSLVNQLNIDQNIATIARDAIGGDFANSTQSATTNVVFTIPSQITTAYFYQVYRSDMATATAQSLLSEQTPDDECRLIIEANPSAQDIANGYINFFDDVPEAFRLNGANLYTNAISGAGILQENSPPPYSQDIALWMNFMFYANTSVKHFIEIDLLTADGLTGNTFTTTYGNLVTTYTFVGDVSQATTITVPAASAFASSGPADYFDIFNAQNLITYRFYFNIGTVTPPSSTGVTLIPINITSTDTSAQVAALLQYAFSIGGQDFATNIASNIITIENLNPGYTNSPINNVTASGFTIVVSTPGSGQQASTQSVGVPNSATPAQQIDAAARSLVYIINRNPGGGIFAEYLSGPTDLPGQILLTAIRTDLVPFYLTASAPIGADFNPALPASGTSVVSNNTTKPNRLYFSKIQEPDAVPQVNYQDIGQEDYPILRIMPLRDSLFILKADGVFRLYGTDPTNFTIYLFDSSTKLLAQDTAAVLNNQVYMLSNQGVVTVSDTGISVISRPIEGNIIPVTTFPDYTSISFAVPYEADRAYLLWIQNAITDTEATICYRYNTFTNTWVSWPITKTCGVALPDTNILYLGPNDINFVEKERKTYTRFDQTDREYVQQVPNNAINGAVLSLGSVFEAEPGDVLVQTQYLTVDQYNRLIGKLNIDKGVQNNYSNSYANIGDNLRDDLTVLAALLDTDPGLTFKDYSSSIVGYGETFQDTQEAFNVIVGLLNTDPGTRFHTYTASNYTTGWESPVESINTTKQTITLTENLPWIVGPISIFKAIPSTVEWAPQHCGDPSMLKKIYEGTFMFENMAFDNAIGSYSSDLYTGQIPIDFNGDGADVWGGVPFGQGTWGGDGTYRPFRTYIPVPVQRCRFIQAYFNHDVAMRTYAIFGVSFTWEGISSRAYR